VANWSFALVLLVCSQRFCQLLLSSDTLLNTLALKRRFPVGRINSAQVSHGTAWHVAMSSYSRPTITAANRLAGRLGRLWSSERSLQLRACIATTSSGAAIGAEIDLHGYHMTEFLSDDANPTMLRELFRENGALAIRGANMSSPEVTLVFLTCF